MVQCYRRCFSFNFQFISYMKKSPAGQLSCRGYFFFHEKNIEFFLKNTLLKKRCSEKVDFCGIFHFFKHPISLRRIFSEIFNIFQIIFCYTNLTKPAKNIFVVVNFGKYSIYYVNNLSLFQINFYQHLLTFFHLMITFAVVQMHPKKVYFYIT